MVSRNRLDLTEENGARGQSEYANFGEFQESQVICKYGIIRTEPKFRSRC